MSLAPSSPLPRGAKNAAAIRKMLKARKNRLANVCTALFMTLPLRENGDGIPEDVGGRHAVVVDVIRR